MAQVTSPIFLDSTAQQIHSDLQQIKNVLTTPSAAADITFDNTGTGMQADDVQDAITELKSNLTDKASRLLTWVFSSPFSRGASYDASSWWDNASEIILMVGNNDTGTNASYWEIHYYKNFEDMTIVNGYGLSGNTFAQVTFNKTNKSITMVDCRMGGNQYNPFCKLYYR